MSDLESELQADVRRYAGELEGAGPQEVLRWAFERYGHDVTLACSFGGASGMALMDMSVRIQPDVDVFYLDTDFLFPETYALREEAERRYGVKPVAYRSRWSVSEQATEFGEALWSKDPDMCCALRKVEPNERALEGRKAWITGIRRDQSSSRNMIRPVEWDSKFDLVKVNPLATWTDTQVWEYILENDVPYNPLHDRGYPSIGCTHCTRAVKPGEDPRAGRWSGFDKTECGIHVPEIQEIGGESRQL